MPRSFFLFIALILLVLFLDRLSTMDREVIDLGIARYPSLLVSEAASSPGSPAESATAHYWEGDRRSRAYRVAYAHGEEAASTLLADHERLGARFNFSWVDEMRFTWQLPESCAGREWTCIYSEVFDRNAVDLMPLIDRIETGLLAEEFSTTEAAEWLLDFVQQIPYRMPTEEAFGILPPALVVSQDWGDCDSKSLLLIALLERVGIDAVLLVSEAHAHALVGIDVPSRGKAHKENARRYAWAETTTEDAPLGWLHPSMKLPYDWEVVPVR
ncbi:MAG: hypothetical protein AB8G23_19985 [Myxococcota bacterium]